MEPFRPVMGVSMCLTGARVRYDGRAKYSPRILNRISRGFDLLPICPEAECGLPIPREPMRLEGSPLNPRLIGIGSRTDYTRQLKSWAVRRVELLKGLNPAGYLFKARSPSCAALKAIPLFDQNGRPSGNSLGLYARLLLVELPGLPVADEESLASEQGLEDFLRACREHARAQSGSLT